MMTIYRGVRFILLMGLLLLAQTRSALADATRLTATFMRCDDLLGRSTEAVLAALGPPARIYELSAAADGAPPDSILPVGVHVVSWSYTSAETTGDLTLIFSNGVLVAARIDDMAYAKILAGLLKTCKLLSLKYIYIESEAKELAKTNGKSFYSLIISGNTQKGHLIRALCSGPPVSPLTYTGVLNVASGLYEDKFTPSRDFSVKNILFVGTTSLTAGDGALYERDSWTAAEKDMQKIKPGRRRIRDLTSYLEDNVPAFNWCPTIIVPMTPENSPWLQQ